MVILGLTGGIGCGKSYVAAKMQLRGIPVYDSDSRAKLLVATSPGLKLELTRLVGPSVYCSCCGQFRKEVLARFIFGNPENLAKVNEIIHPRVKDDFRQWAEKQKCKDFCVLESAILFESGFESETDFKVCVDAPLELRIKRCIERDKTSREAVLKRIENQMDQDEKCKMADFVIVNDGVHDLESQIEAMMDRCKNTLNNKNNYA